VRACKGNVTKRDTRWQDARQEALKRAKAAQALAPAGSPVEPAAPEQPNFYSWLHKFEALHQEPTASGTASTATPDEANTHPTREPATTDANTDAVHPTD
jgi:hypothetical protein